MRKEVVKLFLQKFDVFLDRIASKSNNITIIQTQGTLKTLKEWDNELHPKNLGFKQMARLFELEIRKITNE